jgi:hypothetical protein
MRRSLVFRPPLTLQTRDSTRIEDVVAAPLPSDDADATLSRVAN